MYPIKSTFTGLLFLLCLQCLAQTPEEKLKALNIELPAVKAPIANYVHVVRSGNLLFLSGKGPSDANGNSITGKVGRDLTVEEGQKAARSVAITQIAVLKNELGDLSRVKRIVKVLGMVQCEDTFTEQPTVMNGFSDLMVEVFGEKGKHARSAVGMSSLPWNIAVEVELIVEVEPDGIQRSAESNAASPPPATTATTTPLTMEQTSDGKWVILNGQKTVVYEVFMYDNGPDYASEGLIRVVKNGKIGYADAKTYAIVIEPQFDCAFPFEYGKARVSNQCKTVKDGEHSVWESNAWQYVDKQGKF